MRRGCDRHEERRKGAERCTCAGEAGTWLKMEGDVVMADADEHP